MRVFGWICGVSGPTIFGIMCLKDWKWALLIPLSMIIVNIIVTFPTLTHEYVMLVGRRG